MLGIASGAPTIVPEFCRTMNASPLLIVPSVFTSERKLFAPASCPERLRVSVESPELTLRSPFVSPTNTGMVTVPVPVVVPSFTPVRLMTSVCAFVTPLRFKVTCVPLALKLLTVPVPDVTAAPVGATGFAKVTIT